MEAAWQETFQLFRDLLANRLSVEQALLLAFGLCFAITVVLAHLAKSEVLSRHQGRAHRMTWRQRRRLNEEVRDHLEENYFHVPLGLKR